MVVSLILTLLLFTTVSARVLTECELAWEMETAGFPKDQMENWVCLVKAESSLNTAAVGGPNKNGSYDYGLFQINDYIWCDHENPGGLCNVLCSDLLLDDDIQPSIKCVKIIYGLQGFNAWFGWQKKCKGQVLPPLHC